MNVSPFLITLALSLLALLWLAAPSIRHGLDRSRRRHGSRHVVVSCPHLGLADDPLAHELEPADHHRCYFQMQRDRVDLAHQESFCLTRSHPSCPWLASALTPDRARCLETPLAQLRLALDDVGAWALWVADDCAGRVSARTRALRRTLDSVRAALEARIGPQAMRLLALIGRRSLVALRWLGQLLVRAVRWLTPRLLAAAKALLRRSPRLARWTWGVLAHLGHWLLIGVRSLAAGVAWLARHASVAARTTLQGMRPTSLGARGSRPRAEAGNAPAAAGLAPEMQPATGLTEPAVAEVASTVLGSVVAPAVSAQATAQPSLASDLIARGIASLESGHEDLAYELFVQACKQAPRDVTCWFWRAKTAPALKEVVSSLERAADLAPENDQVRVNLQWAHLRLEREQEAQALEHAAPPAGFTYPPAAPAAGSGRRSRLVSTGVGVVNGISSLLGAAACVVLGLLWIAGALPQPVVARFDAQAGSLLRLMPQLDFAALRGWIGWELPSGYDVISALPFVLGFLALLAAAGLLGREGWARWWAPLIAVVSVALWLYFSTVALPVQALVGLCTVIAIAGPLTATGAATES